MRHRRTPTTTRRGLCFHLWWVDYTCIHDFIAGELATVVRRGNAPHVDSSREASSQIVRVDSNPQHRERQEIWIHQELERMAS